MTLELQLAPQLADRLHREAERRGLPEDAAALKLLEEHLPISATDAETVAILQSWIDEEVDEADQDYDLCKALDEARPSSRKLYPEELKGITW